MRPQSAVQGHTDLVKRPMRDDVDGDAVTTAADDALPLQASRPSVWAAIASAAAAPRASPRPPLIALVLQVRVP